MERGRMLKFQDYDDIFSCSRSNEAYLFGTVSRWAIILIYDDGVIDIIHDDVFKDEISGLQPRWRRLKCLDPQSICCTGKIAVTHVQPDYIFLTSIFAETTDADAMARTA